jgi:hypothetical protein
MMAKANKKAELSPTAFNAAARTIMATEAPVAALPLAEKLKQARAEADAFIDQKTAELKSTPDGALLPIGVLRQMITKHSRCACAVALSILEKENANG